MQVRVVQQFRLTVGTRSGQQRTRVLRLCHAAPLDHFQELLLDVHIPIQDRGRLAATGARLPLMSRALLVIDVQNDVMAQAWGSQEVTGRIAALVASPRAGNAPVIWIQHNDPWLVRGSASWELALPPSPGEPVIDKQFRSAFEQTDLVDALDGVTHLVVCGAETNYCIRHTIHAALERGYDVTLVSDAHTCCDDSAPEIIAEQNANLRDYRLPGRHCVAMPSDTITRW